MSRYVPLPMAAIATPALLCLPLLLTLATATPTTPTVVVVSDPVHSFAQKEIRRAAVLATRSSSSSDANVDTATMYNFNTGVSLQTATQCSDLLSLLAAAGKPATPASSSTTTAAAAAVVVIGNELASCLTQSAPQLLDNHAELQAAIDSVASNDPKSDAHFIHVGHTTGSMGMAVGVVVVVLGGMTRRASLYATYSFLEIGFNMRFRVFGDFVPTKHLVKSTSDLVKAWSSNSKEMSRVMTPTVAVRGIQPFHVSFTCV